MKKRAHAKLSLIHIFAKNAKLRMFLSLAFFAFIAFFA